MRRTLSNKLSLAAVTGLVAGTIGLQAATAASQATASQGTDTTTPRRSARCTPTPPRR